MATMPSAAPSASDPTSPMKISAGYELYQRNPSDAPTSEPQKIVSSDTGGKSTGSRRTGSTPFPATSAKAGEAAAGVAETRVARASSTPVRFTALDSATRMNIAKGT